MKQRSLSILFTALLVTLFSTAIQAAIASGDEDTETRLVQTRVVEVAEGHISVMARSGVEHVISVDRETTRVTMDGRVVSLKDVREGDTVTIDLDARNPVKFARTILMRSDRAQVARVRR